MNYLAPLSLSFFIHIGLILSFSNIFSIDIKSLSLYEIDPIPAYIIYEKPNKQIKKKILSIPKETLAEPKKKIKKIIISEPSIELEEISRSSQVPEKNLSKDVINFSQSDISKYSSIIKQQVMSNADYNILKQIDVNTLITTGEEDVGSTPEMSKNLSKIIPKSKFIEIKKGKHLCSIECEDDVNITIKKFIDQNND